MADTAPQRATMIEVARRAQVSHQTVSRYFSANAGLKPATRARIDAAVKELNYRPNLVARSMRTRQTRRLAVVVPALTYSPARMLAGASAAAHAAGFAVDVLSLEGGTDARTDRIIDLADSGQVDGIVSFAPASATLESQVSSGTTVVVSGDFDDEMRGIGELADASAVAELVQGLAERGHRRFMHVTGLLEFASARARLQVFTETVDRLGLEVVGVSEGDWSAECGVRAMHALNESNRPTAVVAGNDLIAAGVVRGSLERGWRVPEDLSVTGWDNHAIGAFLFPSLTTVDIDLERLGANAMKRLIAALRGEVADPDSAPLTRVIWRESTGPHVP